MSLRIDLRVALVDRRRDDHWLAAPQFHLHLGIAHGARRLAVDRPVRNRLAEMDGDLPTGSGGCLEAEIAKGHAPEVDEDLPAVGTDHPLGCLVDEVGRRGARCAQQAGE